MSKGWTKPVLTECLHSPHPSCIKPQEYGFKCCGIYRRKIFPNLNNCSQFEQRAVATTTSSSSTWHKLLGQFLMLHLPGGTRVKMTTSGQLHWLGSCVSTCIQSEKCVVFLFIVIEKNPQVNQNITFCLKTLLTFLKWHGGTSAIQDRIVSVGKRALIPFRSSVSLPLCPSAGWSSSPIYIYIHFSV